MGLLGTMAGDVGAWQAPEIRLWHLADIDADADHVGDNERRRREQRDPRRRGRNPLRLRQKTPPRPFESLILC